MAEDPDPAKHWMVGKTVDGAVVTSVKETRSDYGDRHIRIRRDVKLNNGVTFWRENFLLKGAACDHDTEEQATFEKQQAEEKARKEAGRAKARTMAQERMKLRHSNHSRSRSSSPSLLDATERNLQTQQKKEAAEATRKEAKEKLRRQLSDASDELRREQEERRKADDVKAGEAHRKTEEEAARLRAEWEEKARLHAEEERRKRKQIRKAEEEEQHRRESKAKQIAQEEARKRAEEEQEEQIRIKEEQQRQAEEEARLKAVDEERAKREAEARRTAEEKERTRQREEEEKRKAEEEANRRMEEEQIRREEREKRKAEEEKRKADEDAKSEEDIEPKAASRPAVGVHNVSNDDEARDVQKPESFRRMKKKESRRSLLKAAVDSVDVSDMGDEEIKKPSSFASRGKKKKKERKPKQRGLEDSWVSLPPDTVSSDDDALEIKKPASFADRGRKKKKERKSRKKGLSVSCHSSQSVTVSSDEEAKEMKKPSSFSTTRKKKKESRKAKLKGTTDPPDPPKPETGSVDETDEPNKPSSADRSKKKIIDPEPPRTENNTNSLVGTSSEDVQPEEATPEHRERAQPAASNEEKPQVQPTSASLEEKPIGGEKKKLNSLPPEITKMKQQNPAFSKILGVWESRGEKAVYTAPVMTVQKRENTPVPTWRALLNKLERKPAEEPPDKLQNVFAEKLDTQKPYTAPVHHKSEEEERFIEQTVGDNFGFENLTPTDIGPLVDAFERVQYEQGATIAEQGQPECYYSIVKTGEIGFLKDGKQVATAGPGEAFGELALLYSCPRAASVKATDHQTVLYQIHQHDFRHIMREQKLRSEEEKLKLLQSVPMFKDLDESDLRQLGAAMTPHTFKEGENLSATFQEAPFCLVQQGSVVASDVSVGPGEAYGEKALNKSFETQKFDVVATSDGFAFTIDKESFENVFGDFERVSLKFRERQVLSKVRAIRIAKLSDDQIDTLARQVVEVRFDAGKEIFALNQKIPPAMYLVRHGRVKVIKKNGQEQFILPGEYFGHEFLMFASKGSRDTVPKFVVAKYAAAAVENTTCGKLTLQDIATVSGRVPKTDLESTKLVALEDLTLHRILGEGQFGKVWLATDKMADNPEPYALKIQNTVDPSREDSAGCIRREISMMREMQYGFIVQLINHYENEAELTISMLLSLAPGGELWDLIHREGEDGTWHSGFSDESDAVFYASIIADTLAFMHRQMYVYRDLKPENVLIDKDGYPVITDFGFVKKLEGTKSGNTYTFCGTPNYIAPEIVSQRGHNTPVDNWSLGVLIYECVDGQNPFFTEGMDQLTLYEMILKGTYYPMDESETSVQVRDLVNRLLRTDPAKRLGTFREKDILEHKWFSTVDIDMLLQRKVPAPWVPPPVQLD